AVEPTLGCSIDFRPGKHFVTTALVVEAAPPAFADVGLIAEHLGTVRQADRAELDAAVAVAVDEPEFPPQDQVPVAFIGGQELVLLEAVRLADDGVAFDLPDVSPPVPAREVLAVPKRPEPGGRGRLGASGEC